MFPKYAEFSPLSPPLFSHPNSIIIFVSLFTFFTTPPTVKKKKKKGWAYLPKKNPTTKTISNTDDTIIIFQTIRSTNTSNCHYSLTPTINKLKKKKYKPKIKKKKKKHLNLNWKFGPEGKKRSKDTFFVGLFSGFFKSEKRREPLKETKKILRVYLDTAYFVEIKNLLLKVLLIKVKVS